MKQEIYSCLKMLETFNTSLIRLLDSNQLYSVEKLHTQYTNIINLLATQLNVEKLIFVPRVEKKREYDEYAKVDKIELLQELINASDITISFLKSLDMNFDKELTLKREELKQKEKELGFRERELEYTKKLLTKSLDAIAQFPELQRSKIVEEIKKSHREIEKSSKPRTD